MVQLVGQDLSSSLRQHRSWTPVTPMVGVAAVFMDAMVFFSRMSRRRLCTWVSRVIGVRS
ncbi:hypothetical protein [Pseudomonas phage PIP]|nr:hypothetical protein [Pseudomonas phage PIP]